MSRPKSEEQPFAATTTMIRDGAFIAVVHPNCSRLYNNSVSIDEVQAFTGIKSRDDVLSLLNELNIEYKEDYIVIGNEKEQLESMKNISKKLGFKEKYTFYCSRKNPHDKLYGQFSRSLFKEYIENIGKGACINGFGMNPSNIYCVSIRLDPINSKINAIETVDLLNESSVSGNVFRDNFTFGYKSDITELRAYLLPELKNDFTYLTDVELSMAEAKNGRNLSAMENLFLKWYK